MKENATKCPNCLIPVEFSFIERDRETTIGRYMCPKCGWYK